MKRVRGMTGRSFPANTLKNPIRRNVDDVNSDKMINISLNVTGCT